MSKLPSKPIIWLEGILSAGKSTLAEQIGKRLKFRVFREPVEDNIYLEDFYKDPKTHGFPMQVHLLEIRAGMQDLAGCEVMFGHDYQGCVLDRGLPGDHCFARLHVIKGNITQRNYETYQLAYLRRTNQMKPPAMMLYLDVSPEVALERLKKRARGAEVGVDIKYLEELQEQYHTLIAELKNGEHEWAGKVDVRIIPWGGDFQPIDPILDMLADKYHLQKF